MRIFEVVELAALLLQADEVLDDIGDCLLDESQIVGTARQTYARLQRCANLALKTVAIQHIRLKDSQKLVARNNKIAFEDFSRLCLQVESIERDGNKVSFDVLPDGIKVQKDGEYLVNYFYEPHSVSIKQEFAFPHVPILVLAYATAYEYCVVCGMYEEAAVWERKYEDSIAAYLRGRKERKIPKRSWY